MKMKFLLIAVLAAMLCSAAWAASDCSGASDCSANFILTGSSATFVEVSNLRDWTVPNLPNVNVMDDVCMSTDAVTLSLKAVSQYTNDGSSQYYLNPTHTAATTIEARGTLSGGFVPLVPGTYNDLTAHNTTAGCTDFDYGALKFAGTGITGGESANIDLLVRGV